MTYRILGLLFLLLYGYYLHAQNATTLVSGEYFFNSDPGLGQASPFTITPGANINQVVSLPVGTLTKPVNLVFIRLKDDNGKWGFTTMFPVISLFSASDKNIVAAEIYANTDPGFGEGFMIPLTPAMSIDQVVAAPASILTQNGLNMVFIRLKDANNQYSIPRVFPVIKGKNKAVTIDAVEVFFGTDPGFGEGVVVQLPAPDSAIDIQALAVQHGLSEGAYQTYMRVLDNAGNWSFWKSLGPITITQPICPVGQFALGINQVSLVNACPGQQNGSINAQILNGFPPFSIQWSHGPTNQSSASNLGPGSYTLNVTDSLGCFASQTFQIIELPGVSVNGTGSHISCHGAFTGTVQITPGGGTLSYTYQWSNGATTQNLSNVPAGNYTVTVTDANNCFATGTFSVTQPAILNTSISNTLNPFCFGDLTGLVNISVSGGAGNYSFLWNNGATTQNLTNVGAGTYVVTVTDGSGCTATAGATLNQPAAINATAVSNFSVNGGPNGSIQLTVSGGIQPYQYAWTNGQQTQNATGLIPGFYSVTVTDVNDCESVFGPFEVEQYDMPQLDCPADISQNTLPGDCEVEVTIDLPVITGGLAPFSLSNNITAVSDASGTYLPGQTLVVFQLTDGIGETATCSFTVTITDNEAPEIICPNNIQVNNDAGLCGAQVVIEQPATATDNCALAGITNSQTGSGAFVNDFFPVGETIITYTATDVNGLSATCQTTVTVNDNESPVVTCTPSVQLAVDEGVIQGFVQVPLATATDNCDAVLSIINNQNGGGANASATYPLGDTEIIYSVTDAAGNTGTCTTLVTVVDEFVINCPAPVTVNTDAGQCHANVSAPQPTLSGGVSPFTVVNDKNSGGLNASDVYNVGTTIVVFTAEDDEGEIAVCSLSVTVVDNEVPQITCPANVNISNTATVCGTQLALGAAVASDNCGMSGISNNLTSGGANVSSFFPVGSTIITYTALDVNGNTNTCQTTVTVNDTEAPIISCASEVLLVVAEGITSAFVNVPLATTTDNCTQTLSISNNFNGGGANASGTYLLGITTVIYSSTDAAGNTGTCATAVTVIDQFALLCSGDIVVNAPANACQAFVTVPQPGTSGGVAPFTITNNITGNTSSPSGTYQVGTTPVIFSATDGDGEVAVCTVNVIVQDVTPPGISCPANVTIQVIQGTPLTQVNLPLATATDLCDANPTISNSFNAGGPAASGQYPPGISNVTFIATDASGNSSSCLTVVNIVENPPLALACPSNITIDCTVDPDDLVLTGSPAVSGFGSGQATVTYVDVIATPNPNCPQQVVITRTFTASEPGGQVVTCVQTITVTDTQAPTAVSKIGAVSLAGAPSYNFTGFEIINLALSSDNCGTLQIESVTPASISQVEGCTTIVLSVIVSDGCGNTVSISNEILVSGGTGEVDDATIGPDNIGFTLQAEPCIGLFEIEVSGQPTSKIDRMQIVYQEVCGDFEFITKLDDLDGPGWGGIVARENLSPGSRKIALKTKLNGQIRRDRRDAQDGAQASLLLAVPVSETWLRMVRTGNNWFLYTGSDGSNWTLRNSGLQTQANCVLVGVFTESEIVRLRPPILSFDPIMTRGLFINTIISLN